MFHPRYSGNPLVNAMCVGVVPLDGIATAGAFGTGNPVLYLGSATGKDGIHGATFASDTLGEDNEEKRPNVQIGDPFAEKSLIEATLEALQTGAIAAIQDMGAAGLTCSTVEMSSKGKVGMVVDLPMRESDMTSYELMLSESQERMLAVACKGREQEVIDVFRKWGMHAVVVGHVTDDGIVKVSRHGKVEAEAPANLFTDECPTYHLVPEIPDYYKRAQAFSIASVPEVDKEDALKLEDSLMALLRSPSMASKRWVYQQYDQQVQTQTSVVPGAADAAVMAPRGTGKGLALKIDGNGRWTYLDPYTGGLLAVAEAARNVACTGGRPAAITDGLNFGTPTTPTVYWQFERAVRGIADAAEVMETPVISGNVSFYNQSDLGEVLPTPIIGMLGVIEDVNKRLELGFPKGKGSIGVVYYETEIGPNQGLGASEYLAVVHGIEDGQPIAPDMVKEKALCEALCVLAEKQLINCAHDLSEGGLAVAIAEQCMAHYSGAHIDVPECLAKGMTRKDAVMFGEVPGRVIVGFAPENEAAIRAILPDGIKFSAMGSYDTLEPNVIIRWQGTTLLKAGPGHMAEVFELAIPKLMAH